jgi:hypothetical protein
LAALSVSTPAVDGPHRISKLIGVPVPTLRTWRVRGGGPPFYRFRRSIKYEDDETLAWARERRALNTTDADQVAARLRAQDAALHE